MPKLPLVAPVWLLPSEPKYIQCLDQMLVFPGNTIVGPQSPSWRTGATSSALTLVVSSTVILFDVVVLGCSVLGAIESFQVFCSGQKKVKVKPTSSWILMDLHIRQSNHIQGTARNHSFGALGVERRWEGTHEKSMVSWGKSSHFYAHPQPLILAKVTLPESMNSLHLAEGPYAVSVLCITWWSKWFSNLGLGDLTMRHTFPLITALFFVTSSWHLSQMLAILLFYCVQELTAFSGVLTCLNYLYLPCVLITVKPNNTYLSLFITHFYLAPSCFRTNMLLFIMVFLMTKCPELKITEDWQHCCCRAAQRWRWHDTAPLAVFVLPHCHTAHPSFAVPG